MQFEDLEKHWQQLDNKLDQILASNNELLRHRFSNTAQHRVNRLAKWPYLDILFCGVVLFMSGSVLAEHFHRTAVAFPAAVLMVAAVALIIDSVRQLNSIASVDWSKTVVEIQVAVGELRVSKLRQLKWILLLSPLVGFCGLIVCLQWLLDWLPVQHIIVDQLHLGWIIANYVFGILFLVFGVGILRFLSSRFKESVWLQKAFDGIAGSGLTKANEDLRRWAELQ